VAKARKLEIELARAEKELVERMSSSDEIILI